MGTKIPARPTSDGNSLRAKDISSAWRTETVSECKLCHPCWHSHCAMPPRVHFSILAFLRHFCASCSQLRVHLNTSWVASAAYDCRQAHRIYPHTFLREHPSISRAVVPYEELQLSAREVSANVQMGVGFCLVLKFVHPNVRPISTTATPLRWDVDVCWERAGSQNQERRNTSCCDEPLSRYRRSLESTNQLILWT